MISADTLEALNVVSSLFFGLVNVRVSIYFEPAKETMIMSVNISTFQSKLSESVGNSVKY